MHVSVPELDVQQAGLTSISVGQVGIGPITVGELVRQNADFAFSAAQAVLRDLMVTVTLRIKVGWHIHHVIDDSGTEDLGTRTFVCNFGNLHVPGLTASTSIGSIELHNVVAPYELLNLTLSQIGIDTVQVPSVAIA
jgi:hypothetical protein